MQRIGVFVCHCGSNIAATVDVKKVVEMVQQEPGVVHAEGGHEDGDTGAVRGPVVGEVDAFLGHGYSSVVTPTTDEAGSITGRQLPRRHGTGRQFPHRHRALGLRFRSRSWLALGGGRFLIPFDDHLEAGEPAAVDAGMGHHAAVEVVVGLAVPDPRQLAVTVTHEGFRRELRRERFVGLAMQGHGAHAS